MFPDNGPHQAGQPASLPQVQAGHAFASQVPAGPVAATEGTMSATGLPTEQIMTQIKLLISQYGSNPHAFNVAFQQLKTKYLLEHHHIDANPDKS
jgi:hypothetical protein